ncbi:DNA polymerase III subunit gamma/tau [Weissella confusa]|uniref:DNA polymerase III subunit gamma/tau n=2 Tax=Weissella confusa TaxID=1583 RepID=UPI0013DF4FA7|nr:DNA polymerase III subunit gamma/tau [Weissella confusa]QIE78214.1 DNA polymerase III subunit gamma/tau [Weissella confusa]
MFNSDVKKAAIANLQKKADEMNAVVKDTMKHSEELYTVRVRSQEQIQHSIDLINQLKNTPIEIDTKIEKIKVSMKNYTRILEAAKADAANVDMKAGGAMAGGVAMGVGVAALGPAAAMGIATTFGVASTGAAISGLSGIAATNAALAWLGGGALAAGGAGVAGGEAFLALAGPIGWAIGGAALVGGGLFMNGKNKKIASEANQKAAEIVAQTKTQKVINQEIAEMINLTSKDVEYLNEANEKVELMDKDFNNLDDSSVYFLGAYVNNVSTTVERLNAIIGEHGYTVSQKRALKL